MTGSDQKGASFTCTLTRQEDIPIVLVQGYYNDRAGARVHTLAKPEMIRGCKSLIIDLSGCNLINSPGVVTVIELGLAGSEEYGCRVIVCGLDKVKTNVFEVAGVFNFAEIAPDLAAAVSLAKG